MIYREEFEDTIIKAIHRGGGFMSVDEVAKLTRHSYVTTKKYLERLHKLGIVKKEGDRSEKRGNEETQEK